MVTEHNITFDRTLNAVDDLGWDPTGSEPIELEPYVETGTLIEVPPGQYTVPTTQDIVAQKDGVERFGIRGTAADRRDVEFRPEGDGSTYLLWLTGGRDILLKNYRIWYGTEDQPAAIGHVLLPNDGLYVQKLQKNGFTPSNANGDRWFLFLAIQDTTGIGYVEDVHFWGPANITGHGASRGFGGAFQNHAGTLYWRELNIFNNPGDGAPYVGTHGTNRFENCLWVNCAMAAARNGGSDSYVKNCEIRIDLNDQNPRNIGTYESINGIYWDPQTSEEAGGRIENCEIRIEEPTNPNGAGYSGDFLPGWGIVVDSSGGDVAVERNDITINADRVPALMAHAPEKRWDRAPADVSDWGILVNDNEIRGGGVLRADDSLRNAAIVLERRPGSAVTDTLVDWPDAAYAVGLIPWQDDQTQATIDDLRYDVRVEPIYDPANNADVGDLTQL
ncbi:hypothetical protein [Halomarina pelagica]|uniref:hypothetical protein n=1 Tax=Halomarina pelagica TaxID=2961599 RepID=UPI0020C53918|nr:hypothetical protein [Halomarina sp. BND7]